MEMEPNRLKRISRLMYYLSVAFYYLGIAVLILGVVLFAVQFFLPDSLFTVEQEQFGITIDNVIYFSMNTDNGNAPISLKPLLQIALPFALVILALFVVGVNQVMELLKTVAKDNPFDENNSDRLYRVGRILLISSLIVGAGRVVIYKQMFIMLNLSDVHTNFSVNVALLLTGLLVLILAGVFKYGSYLKNEYDATV
jgi:hypothetical protein